MHDILDKDFLFARLYTQPIMRDGEMQQAEVDVRWDMADFKVTPSKESWIKRLIIVHLTECVYQTSIPAEKWIIEFSPVVQQMLNFPSHLPLSTNEARRFLL